MKMKFLVTMNKKPIWLITCFLLLGATVMAQCNYRLVEKAAQQAGADAIYIRDFKVKLSKGTMDEPSPTGNFPVYLSKGVTYRFSVANAEEYPGKAIVEVARRDQIYAGNYDFNQNNYSETFDFTCERSSTYQVLINYGEGKEGCTAVVMAMVLQDSMAYIEPGIPLKSDSAGTLYLFTNNELQIASSAGKDAELAVSISQGTISEKGQYYIAHPETTGEAQIHVIVSKNGQVIETDSVLYKVDYPPLPMIQLPGEISGILSLSRFNGIGQVTTKYIVEESENPYTLKEFSIAPGKDVTNEILSDKDKLSPQQIFLIKSLKPNDRIYIVNAIFIDPEGNLHRALSREIYLAE